MSSPLGRSLLAAVAVLGALAFAPRWVWADEYQGWYVGAGAGEYYADDVFQNDAFQIFGGWRFSPYLALQASYMNLGGYRDDGFYSHNYTQGFAPWLVGTLPLWRPPAAGWGPIELFGKVGQYFYRNQNVYRRYGPSLHHYHNDFVYGGGIGVVISSRFEVRAEADKLNLANTYDAYAWWATFGYRF